MSSGKGISDAVRNAIGEWVTPELVKQLEDASGLKLSVSQLSIESSWVRYRRAHGGGGWERDYRCKASERVGLRVHTNPEDTHIKFVTFKVGDRFVGGGKVHVPSILVSQNGRRAAIKAEATPVFTPFTAADLDRLNTQRQYGESALLDMMFDERMV